ncbi:MAG: DUF484 family protein [Candidatus Oxydemutatoraceae bacterium WSBS_2016_MAG_OTU14]
MSKLQKDQQGKAIGSVTPSESLKICAQDVAQFLAQQEDFYQQYPQLFVQLQLHHGAKDGTSLLEKQNNLLRKQCQEHAAKMKALMQIALSNEQRAFALHYLACRLLLETNALQTLSVCQRMQAIELACKEVLLQSLKELQVHFLWSQERFESSLGTGLNIASFADQRIAGLVRRLFAAGKPECGPFSAAERVLLVPNKHQKQVGSAVVIPLQSIEKKLACGLLVLFSPKKDKFVAGQGTMFLRQLKHIIEHACNQNFAIS